VAVPTPTSFPVPGSWQILAQVEENPGTEDGRVPRQVDLISDQEDLSSVSQSLTDAPELDVDFATSVVLWVRYGFSTGGCEDLSVVNVEEAAVGSLVVHLGLPFERDVCNDDDNPRSTFVAVRLADLSAIPLRAELSP